MLCAARRRDPLGPLFVAFPSRPSSGDEASLSGMGLVSLLFSFTSCPRGVPFSSASRLFSASCRAERITCAHKTVTRSFLLIHAGVVDIFVDKLQDSKPTRVRDRQQQ